MRFASEFPALLRHEVTNKTMIDSIVLTALCCIFAPYECTQNESARLRIFDRRLVLA
jgi:hypothetical protein